MESAALLALGLTLLAGLSTGIGSLLALVTRRSNKGALSLAMGFSAGVMIYVSFVELLPTGIEMAGSRWGVTAAFFAGMLFTTLIDWLIPEQENPHEAMLVEEMAAPPPGLHRAGMLTALAIAIHNFPEGIATFMSTLADPAIGVSIAIAVALHNIPEGISISVPVYYATGSRKKAFWYSFGSGLAEPVGALLAYLLLAPLLDDALLGAIFGAVAGIMVFISLDQLIPNAKKYDEGHLAVYGLIGGMALMALSLLLLTA